MLRTNYTAEDQQTFEQLRYSYPDERIMRRFEILWLHACGKTAPEIASLVRRDPRTVRTVLKNFQKSDIKLVTTIEFNHPTSDLEIHRTSLIEEFTLRSPSSVKEAAFRIKKLHDIDRSPERVRVFLKNIGLKYRKVGAIPAKADLEKQDDFKKSV